MTGYKKRRTPGNRSATKPVSRKPSKPTCKSCGSLIHGVKRMATVKFAGSAATQKRVSRIFGGSMCASCARGLLRQKARTT